MRPYSFISNYLQSSGWELVSVSQALEGVLSAGEQLLINP